MKTYEDCLKEHGWKKGLWNDPFAKIYVEDTRKKAAQKSKDR